MLIVLPQRVTCVAHLAKERETVYKGKREDPRKVTVRDEWQYTLHYW